MVARATLLAACVAAASGKRAGNTLMPQTEEDRTATLVQFTDPAAEAVKAVTKESAAGDQAAHETASIFENVTHYTDVVVSDHHRLVYVDNVKAGERRPPDACAANHTETLEMCGTTAGSTTIRNLLKRVLGADWHNCGVCPSWDTCHGGRSNTQCLTPNRESYFVFSFVRHPVRKFESGVRQTWFVDQSLRKLSADEMLQQQLKADLQVPQGPQRKGTWMNEHLQSNTFRLTGFTSLEKPVRLDFVGQLERLEDDLSAAADLYDSQMAADTPCARLNATARCGLRLLLDAYLQSGGQIANARDEVPGSLLSPEGVQTLCTSDAYGASTTSAPLATALGKYDCNKPPVELHFQELNLEGPAHVA